VVSRDNGVYVEKWAAETQCRGDTVTLLADSYITYAGAATKNITGLDHLENQAVVVWADGEDVGTEDDYTQTYRVNSGAITLATAASHVVVGLPYTAQFKSARTGGQQYAFSEKRFDRIGLYMAWLDPKGLRYGPDFDNLDDMPEIEEGTTVDSVWSEYDESMMFPGVWGTNERLCLQAQAPRPCTVLAAILEIDA